MVGMSLKVKLIGYLGFFLGLISLALPYIEISTVTFLGTRVKMTLSMFDLLNFLMNWNLHVTEIYISAGLISLGGLIVLFAPFEPYGGMLQLLGCAFFLITILRGGIPQANVTLQYGFYVSVIASILSLTPSIIETYTEHSVKKRLRKHVWKETEWIKP